MLVDKHKIEKEQNAQLRNQVAQLLQLEQDQKLQIQQRDMTIQTLQVGIIYIYIYTHTHTHTHTYFSSNDRTRVCMRLNWWSLLQTLVLGGDFV
jgi:hypothetical protein